MLHSILHLALHVAVPGLAAWLFFRPRWVRSWLVMLGTMVVDADHLLANPVFDPDRCSIGFHPLHTAPAIVVYGALTIPRPTRLFGIGLLIHIGLDLLDCLWMRYG